MVFCNSPTSSGIPDRLPQIFENPLPMFSGACFPAEVTLSAFFVAEFSPFYTAPDVCLLLTAQKAGSVIV